MAFLVRQLGFALLVLGLTQGCYDRRLKNERPTSNQDYTVNITPIADIRYKGKAIETMAMEMDPNPQNEILRITGKPFGVAAWDLNDPENPTLLAEVDVLAASQRGAWAPAWYASNALTSYGANIFTSGSFGASMFSNLPGTFQITEVGRFPPTQNSVPVADAGYQYAAVVKNPRANIIYGFQYRDYYLDVDVSQPSSVRLLRKTAYSSNTMCCVVGATYFADKVFVAFRSTLWFFNLASDGRLGAKGEYSGIHPIGIASTPDRIYIQHDPITAKGSTMAAGIYAYDTSGKRVAFYPLTTPNGKFAVSHNNRYLYAPYVVSGSGSTVRIYKLQDSGSGLPVY